MNASAPPRRRLRPSSLAAGVMAVAPMAATLLLIQRLAVNIPYQDDWDMLPVVTRWHAGTATLGDFWQQHSEHRVIALKGAIWAIGSMTDFDVVAQMTAGFAMAVTTFVLMADLLRSALKNAAPLVAPLVAVSSLLMFSLVQHENWFFATASVQLFLLNLCTVTLVWVLTRWPNHWESLAVAAASATVAMFTEISGQLLWLTGAAAIVIAIPAPRERLQRLTVWAVAGCATVTAYFWNLHWATSAVGAAVSHPIRVLLFIGACLGLPFGSWAGPQWSAVVGFEACVILGVACWSLQRRNPLLCRQLFPVLLLALHGLLATVLIAIGRAGGDPGTALTSHYAFAPTLFWIAVCTVTAAETLSAWPARTTFARRRGFAAAVVVTALLTVAYANVNIAGYREAYARSRNLRMARAAVLSDAPTREVLRFLYPPDEQRVQQLLHDLRRFGLGPYASASRDPENALADRAAAATDLAEGYFDGGDCTGTTGWAWDPGHPDAPIVLDIWTGDTRLGTVRADWFRWDLRAAGKGNGQHAFRFLFPNQAELRTGQLVTVTFADTQRPISGSPRMVPCRD